MSVTVAAEKAGVLLAYQVLGGITLTTSGSQVIASSVLASNTVNDAIQWDGVVVSDFGTEVFDQSGDSTLITPPANARWALIFASISFSANATGQRWIRLLNGSNAHYSNFMMNACGVLTTQVPLPPALVEIGTGVNPFNSFKIIGAQNSGSSLTVQTGANQGGSTYMRALFLK